MSNSNNDNLKEAKSNIFLKWVEYMDNDARNKQRIASKKDIIEEMLFIHSDPMYQPKISFIDKNVTIQNDKLVFNIDRNIQSIKDLIELCDAYPEETDCQYSVDLKTLRDIKSSLVKLNNFIGIKDIKEDLLHQILYYIQKMNGEHEYMHIVISGPPGCGKTELAKIIGEIFTNMNVLKKKTFKKAVRSDLIAGYLGQTAIKTKELIDKNVGGVVFIDEAYSLGHREKNDSFAKECIDTLNECLSDYKDKLMVIVAGYKDELDETFFRMNPGLKSRFPWMYHIDKYDADELRDIFILKFENLEEQHKKPWKMNINKVRLKEWFDEHYKIFTGYGRDMDILLSSVKIAHSKRVFTQPNDRYLVNMKDLKEGLMLLKRNREEAQQKENENDYTFNMYT